MQLLIVLEKCHIPLKIGVKRLQKPPEVSQCHLNNVNFFFLPLKRVLETGLTNLNVSKSP